jgi:hypothetical protein
MRRAATRGGGGGHDHRGGVYGQVHDAAAGGRGRGGERETWVR